MAGVVEAGVAGREPAVANRADMGQPHAPDAPHRRRQDIAPLLKRPNPHVKER